MAAAPRLPGGVAPDINKISDATKRKIYNVYLYFNRDVFLPFTAPQGS